MFYITVKSPPLMVVNCGRQSSFCPFYAVLILLKCCFYYKTPKIGDKPNMAKKHREVQKLLAGASEAEIQITFLPGGATRIDIAPHGDTPEEIARWKEALDEAEGLWKDRENIEEEMKSIRRELNRTYSENNDAKTS